jgi:cytochrome b subunit of formate dehydrogenase
MVCEPCHSSVVLNQSYGLPTTQVSSYFDSYHGLAILRGSTVAANCTSCHGVHNIYASYDPRSTVNPANLQKTCGRCHPGARASFAQTPVHAVRRKELKAVTYIKDAYIILIIVTISGMFVHNMIIYLSFVVAKRRKYRIEPTVDRFNLNMVVQHAILFICFITLVITGFALKFPGVFALLGSLGIDEHQRGVIHRIAASGLVAAGLYHLYWILFARRGKVEFRQMLPKMQDFKDLLASMRYYLRLSSQRPEHDRYSYVEKVEYWALIWGTTIMAVTGFILWFPVRSTDLLGPWVTPVATTIHFYEALLATLAIVVWHFFFTILHPEEYPMSMVWIDGKATVEEIRKHRPAWFRRMNEESEKKQEKGNVNEREDAGGQPDQDR